MVSPMDFKLFHRSDRIAATLKTMFSEGKRGGEVREGIGGEGGGEEGGERRPDWGW